MTLYYFESVLPESYFDLETEPIMASKTLPFDRKPKTDSR